MESFLSRYRNPLILLAVVLAQLLGLAVQVRRPATGRDSHQVRVIRYWAVAAISPFERAFLFVGHSIGDTWTGYLDLRHVRAENAELQAEVNRLRLEQASVAESVRQNVRLRKLLGFQQKYVSKTVAAHVIGTSGTESSRVLYIDKGSDAGLRTDLPVITPDGVVGKVLDVFPHTAQVLEINDPSSGLGVILTKSRLRGILRGNSNGQIEIVNVMPDEQISAGDAVVTSGGDQIYPRGIPVGTVERIVKDPRRNPYVAILVRPSVHLSRLDEVLVVTQTTDTMPEAMQQDLSTSQQKASDILSERLPGANLAPKVGPDGLPLTPNPYAVPPPVSAPAPIHPDRFTPGATPDAAALAPGAAYPKEVFPSAPANPPSTPPGAPGAVTQQAEEPAATSRAGTSTTPKTVASPEPTTPVQGAAAQPAVKTKTTVQKAPVPETTSGSPKLPAGVTHMTPAGGPPR